MSDGVRVDARDFGALMRSVKAFEPKLGTDLRRTIRQAAQPVLADMRSALADAPAKKDYGVRAGIAAGIAVRVDTPKKGSGGVRITASSAKLPENRRAMLRLMNKKSWRHPVFGTGKWVQQSGRPYFGAVITAHTEQFARAVEEALSAAAESIGKAAS